ncbi:MAG: hypothetical protein DRR08_26045 [Candidatus Parabeggiatoa sp. nov. 2]|nr:MAG: hypothetical protein B6247_25090 [Beggiatoa sp. 4572_84]RKZ54775.1 MAG: hypothetical protein DRR08_26045 [Gammaproteobacteria bacterium]
MYTRTNWFFMRIVYVLCLLGFGLTLQGCIFPPPPPPPPNPPLKTTQHALVVGINKYRHVGKVLNASGNVLTNLSGTVNDALLLAEALRRANVKLPNERILLNEQATRSAFLQAWRNMIKQAQPGDTLIVTFSGHGGQELDTWPLDENKDCRENDDECEERDETLLFHDFYFDKQQLSSQGRLIDDELRSLLEKASAYKIVFVIDACHSAGMMKGAQGQGQGQVRTAGFFKGKRGVVEHAKTEIPSLPSPQADEAPLPEHVTLITAVHIDNRLVSETSFNGKKHGALSWFFDKALRGQADGNKNGYLERDELENFLVKRVKDHMEMIYPQVPKILPRGDNVAVLKLGNISESPEPSLKPNLPDIAIRVKNGVAPQNLKYVRFINSEESFDLLFIIKTQQTQVFNEFNEQVATLPLPSDAPHLWQRVINKERLLRVLRTQFDMRLQPVSITLREGDGLHKQGEVLHFDIAPGNTQEGLNALTLFNLASDGELQVLYPWPNSGDPLKVEKFPYTIPPLEVKLPFGKDNLVVLLCSQPTEGLHDLLADSQPNIPEPEKILAQLHKDNNRCQVGQYAFFSSE